MPWLDAPQQETRLKRTLAAFDWPAAEATCTEIIVNEIRGADVDENGTLTMTVEVVRRRCIEQSGEPPIVRFGENLRR